MAVDPTQIPRVNIEDEAPIKVAYNDPSLAGQYSEFMTKEDIDPEFEKEDPLFKSLQDNPLTIGQDDKIGYGAGTNLWSLSEKQKEAREKQLGKFGTTPDSLLFDLDFKNFGQFEDVGLGISSLDKEYDSLFLQEGDEAATLADPVKQMEESVQPIDERGKDFLDDRSWLEQQRDKLLADPQKTKEQAESIWNILPRKPVYDDSFRTGLATRATPSSVGTSAAPPHSLAGSAPPSPYASTMTTRLGYTGSTTPPVGYGAIAQQGVKAGTAAAKYAGWTGTGYGKLAPATSAYPSWSQLANVGSQLLTVWSAKNAFDSGTNEGKFSGSLQLATLVNPTLIPYVAAYEAIKWLTGWGGIGSWFGGGKQKPPMGGVEYRVTSTDIIEQNNGQLPSDSDQSAWLYPGSEAWDKALAEDKLRITAPYSWGYNGFNDGDWKAISQKNVDYLYAFADRYGLDVNEDVFYKAALGVGGFEKYKPSGDRGVSVFERVDSIGNGAASANQWLREVMEYEGPNGEKIVDGTPRSSNINPETGMYDGFVSQEEFQQDVEKFNSEFYG